MQTSISHLSTEYVKVGLRATSDGVAIDPTSDVVEFAFTLTGDNDPVTWFTGDWETDGARFVARCLVGPNGGVTSLDAATYLVWVRVTDSPEIPVKPAGSLLVF